MNKLFPRYEDKTLDEFQILDPTHEKAIQAVTTYTTALPEARADGHGLTFIGPAGVGKTYLAQMVLKAAKEQGFSIESIELYSYIQLHHDRISWSQQGDMEALEKVNRQIRRVSTGTDFVLLDDIGREHDSGSGWTSQILFNTLRYRYNRKTPFILTTNLPLSFLDQRYTEGLVSLLHEVTEIIVVEGDDYRCAAGR